MDHFDVAVVGGGPSGYAAVCLLARAGVSCVLVAGQGDAGADPRTVALMLPTLDALQRIGVWPGSLRSVSAPLRRLVIIDDAGAVIRAPILDFPAREAGGDAFGWNVPLANLIPALRAAAEAAGCTVRTEDATNIINDKEYDAWTIETASTRVRVRVLIGADGQDSKVRVAAGIEAERWSYDQAAIATSFAHSRSHGDTSREYHRPAGPFTTVPLPGGRSSLVWMERPARADALMAIDNDGFAAEVQAASHGDLGLITDIGPRRRFAMTGLAARVLAANRALLIGEAAHALPPIGAQGLNMSLADAAAAAELIGAALARGGDPGADDVLAAYARRRPIMAARQAVVDLMNRSLLAGFPAFDAARAVSLAALASVAPLRRFAVRAGLGG